MNLQAPGKFSILPFLKEVSAWQDVRPDNSPRIMNDGIVGIRRHENPAMHEGMQIATHKEHSGCSQRFAHCDALEGRRNIENSIIPVNDMGIVQNRIVVYDFYGAAGCNELKGRSELTVLNGNLADIWIFWNRGKRWRSSLQKHHRWHIGD